MKRMRPYLFLAVLLPFTIVKTHGQSFSCSPEDVTWAGKTTSGFKVEKTTVNWKRIDYNIMEKKAITTTYKDPESPITKINPQQKDELTVLENLPDKIVMLGGSMTNPLSLTMDVIFPLDGNGYSFYVSDFWKTHVPGKSEMLNASKLYVLKCKDTSKAVSQ